MTIAQFEAMLAREGVPFVHITPDEESRDAAINRFEEEGYYTRNTRFIVAEPFRYQCSHVPVVIIEDPLYMDARVVAEAELIAAEYEGTPPMVIYVGQR